MAGQKERENAVCNSRNETREAGKASDLPLRSANICETQESPTWNSLSVAPS